MTGSDDEIPTAEIAEADTVIGYGVKFPFRGVQVHQRRHSDEFSGGWSIYRDPLRQVVKNKIQSKRSRWS